MPYDFFSSRRRDREGDLVTVRGNARVGTFGQLTRLAPVQIRGPNVKL